MIAHTGDSHVLLPAFLERLAEAGRTVDFALVDGDHTPRASAATWWTCSPRPRSGGR